MSVRPSLRLSLSDHQRAPNSIKQKVVQNQNRCVSKEPVVDSKDYKSTLSDVKNHPEMTLIDVVFTCSWWIARRLATGSRSAVHWWSCPLHTRCCAVGSLFHIDRLTPDGRIHVGTEPANIFACLDVAL